MVVKFNLLNYEIISNYNLYLLLVVRLNNNVTIFGLQSETKYPQIVLAALPLINDAHTAVINLTYCWAFNSLS